MRKYLAKIWEFTVQNTDHVDLSLVSVISQKSHHKWHRHQDCPARVQELIYKPIIAYSITSLHLCCIMLHSYSLGVKPGSGTGQMTRTKQSSLNATVNCLTKCPTTLFSARKHWIQFICPKCQSILGRDNEASGTGTSRGEQINLLT